MMDNSSSPLVSGGSPEATLESSPTTSNESGYYDGEGPVTPTSMSSELDDSVQIVSSDANSPLSLLMDRTGCTIVQQNGQRRFGPPMSWTGQPPPRGTEVFVGKIPRDCFEDELVPLFERCGHIYELRLMMDHHTGQNRGYAFVVYAKVLEAKDCVKLLNNVEIRKGRSLGICMSVDNCRLFIGGIPKRVSKADILQEMQAVTEGVVDVIVYPSAVDKTKNRGFAFIEYESHRSAAMARRKLMNGRIQLWGHNIAVDWAEPELEVDQEIMAQVKVLYVRNLMLSTTEAAIEQAFSSQSTVERVKKIKDYAFVHFTTRDNALEAMGNLNGAMLDGAQIEVTLAKPVDKDTYMKSPKYQRQFNSTVYVPVDQYGTILPFYPSYLSSPKYMLRNSMGACTMLRVPRGPPGRLPTPQTGLFPVALNNPRYVYPPPNQRPTMIQPNNFGERVEEPGPPTQYPTIVTPQTTTLAVKHKTTVQMLDEVCQKHNWGPPIYNLHSTSNQTQSAEDVLFLYKVTISVLGTTYMPNKLSRTVEEARMVASEYTLTSLGYPMDGIQMVRPLQYTELPPNFVTVQGSTKQWNEVYPQPFLEQSYNTPGEVYQQTF